MLAANSLIFAPGQSALPSGFSARGEEELIATFVAFASEAESLPEEAIERAKRVSSAEGKRLDVVLNRLGLVSDDAFARAWSLALGLQVITADDYPLEPALSNLLSAGFLRQSSILPISADNKTIQIALLNPLDHYGPRLIGVRTGLLVEKLVARPAEFLQAMDRLYPSGAAEQPIVGEQALEHLIRDTERLRETDSDAPVIRLVQAIIERAVVERASDIHFTVSEYGPRLRFRIDGLLKDRSAPLNALYLPLISRIKILSGLDIAEQRVPQDGSFRIVVQGREVDVRASTMPHLHGEGVVLRLLDRSTVKLDLAKLGASPAFILRLSAAVRQPNGLILMTGPTGSGKTTTLYAALRSIQRSDRNIVTIEDPVEYSLANITQIEINTRVDLTFPVALRAILRQDPDVILVGEIRNQETATIAARAAMTGHLVLASLHTNSAVEALSRLVDLDVEPYVVASTVRAVIAQRLVRKLCPQCRREVRIKSEQLRTARIECSTPEIIAFEAVGCDECNGSGYSGRIIIAEFITVTEGIRASFLDRQGTANLTRLAIEQGGLDMHSDALEKLRSGVTDLAEIERVIGCD